MVTDQNDNIRIIDPYYNKELEALYYERQKWDAIVEMMSPDPCDPYTTSSGNWFKRNIDFLKNNFHKKAIKIINGKLGQVHFCFHRIFTLALY